MVNLYIRNKQLVVMFMRLNKTKLFLLFLVEFLGGGGAAGHLYFSGVSVPAAAPLWCFLLCRFGAGVILWGQNQLSSRKRDCQCSSLVPGLVVVSAHLCPPGSSLGLRLQYLWGEGRSSPWLPAVLAQTETCWSKDSRGKEVQGRLAKSTVRVLKS